MKISRKEEVDIIEKILAFEEQTFHECKEKIKPYQEMMTSLGVEIRITLLQSKGSSIGPSKFYNLRESMVLPRFYSSDIHGFSYKDGKPITKQEEYDKRITSLFVLFFPLVRFQKKGKELYFFQETLNNFDRDIKALYEKLVQHLT